MAQTGPDDEKADATDAGVAIVTKYFAMDATEPTWSLRFWREMANQTFDSIKDPDERLSYLDAWETRVRAEIVDPARKYEVRTHNAILQAIAEWRLRQQQQE